MTARTQTERTKSEKQQPKSTLADAADRHELYQMAVQDADGDVDFLERAWREAYGDARQPQHLREDFCGTALLSATWVKRAPDRSAEGFDIDADCLQWGRDRNLSPLGADANRVTLHEKDVRGAGDRPADVLCAHNFSYQILRERSELLEYFRIVRSGLSEQGIFVMDLYGGSEAMEEIEEERDIEDADFTYVWEQKSYHPATGHTDCCIHFLFPDGSEMRNAFEYEWRLYSPAELRDVLMDAGFREVRTYFEEFDDDGDGTGVFARDEEGCPCEGWIGYMVAIP